MPCAVSTATVKRRRFHRNKMMAASFQLVFFYFPAIFNLILNQYFVKKHFLFIFFSRFPSLLKRSRESVSLLLLFHLRSSKSEPKTNSRTSLSFSSFKKLKFIDLVCAKFVSVHKNSVCQWHQTRQELHLHLKELAL